MLAAMSSPAFTLSNPAGLYDPTDNAYSHVAQVSLNARIVHLAGQGGQDREGYLAPDFADQVRQTIANVEIGLAAAGATLNDVYKLTILWSITPNHASPNGLLRQNGRGDRTCQPPH